MLVGAVVLRVPGIDKASIEPRETQSALLARTWSADETRLAPWQREVLDGVRETIRPIEPPILDALAAASHYLLGHEAFWPPRLVSSLLWVAGGVFVWLVALRVTRWEGALVALMLYLLWPYAVWHSRLFMPDATMIFALLGASLTTVRYWERPTGPRLLAAGGAASLATAVKPGVAFFVLLGLFVALAAEQGELRESVRGALPVFSVLALALSAAYYVYGAWIDDFISSGASTRRITPGLLGTPSFWRGWWEVVSFLLRFPQEQEWLALVPIAAGLGGLVASRAGQPRAILGGLAGGYLVFAFAFANLTSTHPYYSLVLVPILALAIGALAGSALDRVAGHAGPARAVLLSVLAVVVLTAGYKANRVLATPEPLERIADYRRIGEVTDHTTRAIIVDRQLATPSMYWGWIVGRNWELDYNETLPPWLDGDDFDYLVVVGVDQLDNSAGLRRFARGLRVVERTDRFAVFALRPSR
jgi:hypothetical protein